MSDPSCKVFGKNGQFVFNCYVYTRNRIVNFKFIKLILSWGSTTEPLETILKAFSKNIQLYLYSEQFTNSNILHSQYSKNKACQCKKLSLPNLCRTFRVGPQTVREVRFQGGKKQALWRNAILYENFSKVDSESIRNLEK